jgi:hypothetical protein
LRLAERTPAVSLIGYESGGCMIAFLAVERQRLLQWLRPRLGWSI